MQDRAEYVAQRIKVFALSATGELGTAIARGLGEPLSAHEERKFEDGEHKARPLIDVSDADAYVIQSLHGGPSESANDKLCGLLFFIGALKDAGAARVTAVVPYLCYARKDRRTKPNDPVTTRYVAAMFEAAGADTLVTLEVHNPVALENAFRRRTVTLTATPLFVDFIKSLGDKRYCVVSPDPGGAKRAELFREELDRALACPIGKAFADKTPQRWCCVRRFVHRGCGGRHRLDRGRSDQYRKHRITGGARRSCRRRPPGDRAGDPRSLHARR